MIAKTLAATVLGVEAHLIQVEVDLALGLSQFTIVGLPDGTIKESRERITAAIANSGFAFPIRRITCNLAPAEMRKIGAGFDLPIAACLLGGMGELPAEALADYLLVGELSLEGTVRPVRGVLPIALAARASGVKGLVLPRENELEAAVVDDGGRRLEARTPGEERPIAFRMEVERKDKRYPLRSMDVAARLYEQGLGTAITDNLAGRLYVVVEPPEPRERGALDASDLEAIVPGRALTELARVAGAGEAEIELDGAAVRIEAVGRSALKGEGGLLIITAAGNTATGAAGRAVMGGARNRR